MSTSAKKPCVPRILSTRRQSERIEKATSECSSEEISKTPKSSKVIHTSTNSNITPRKRNWKVINIRTLIKLLALFIPLLSDI